MLSLSPLEVATGIVHGAEPDRGCEQWPPAREPLAALERECLAELTRPPCLVSFSGGIDSSLVLAVAARVARREGLAAPIPATNRFPGVAHADESRWQELVVRHLGLADWLRLDHGDELDAVGPVATRALCRHGLLWPFNAHFHAPLLEAAAGGSLLTGIGGDEAFGSPRWSRAARVLTGRARPRPRDAARVALLAAPRPLRRTVLARRLPAPFPWLTADARRELAHLWAADEAAQPLRPRPRLQRFLRLRALRLGLRSLDLLAADAGARIAHPLASGGFCAALAANSSPLGFPDRATAVRELFGELLPPQLLARRTKARFEGAFWRRYSREVAAAWDGEAADPALVDRAALRSLWAGPEPDAHTYLLLQAAWLERHRRRRPAGGSKFGPIGAPTLAPAATRGYVDTDGSST